jgi:hypothetical protein
VSRHAGKLQARLAHLSLSIAVGLLTAGCGSGTPVERAQQGSGSLTTANVGLPDAGKTVRMQVGDRLVVSLGAGGRSWTMMSFPRKVLSFPATRDRNWSYVFVAKRRGWGVMRFIRGFSCGPPRAMSLRCPVQARSNESGTSRSHQALFWITVRVE